MKKLLLLSILTASLFAETDYIKSIKQEVAKTTSFISQSVDEIKKEREIKNKFCMMMENTVSNDYINIRKSYVPGTFNNKILQRKFFVDMKMYENCNKFNTENIKMMMENF